MLKRLIVLILFLFPFFQFAQDYSALWQGHFSFYNIKDVVRGSNKIYAASDNAIFSYNDQTKEVSEITTINGLSGEQISTIHYSEAYQLLLIGYENGLIEIAFDNNDGVLTVVDVIDKVTIPPTSKRINHFNEYGSLVYVATNYGISVYNLERLEFGDTYFIGNAGAQVKVLQTTVFNDAIYAACQDSGGLKKASASNPNLIDFQNWQTVTTGNFSGIEAVENNLFAIRTNSRIYQITSDVLTERFLYNNQPLDIKSSDGNLIVTTKSDVYVYDSDFNIISQASTSADFTTDFTSAVISEDSIYIGTKDFGVLKTSLLSPTIFEEVHPDGPLRNVPFSIKATPNSLWVTFGDYTVFYNPYPLDRYGYSLLKNNQWINTPYSEVFEAKCLNAISINPNNPNQVFISSFFNGLLEVNDYVPTMLYNETNSGLESLILPNNPAYIDVRVGASTFDSNGILWTTSGIVENPLKSYNPQNNQWVNYSLDAIIPDPFDNNGFADIIIDNNGTKWMAAGYSYGVIAFNENNGNPLIKGIYSEDQNMPFTFASALALDKRNQLWIGTYRGLRVLYNTSGIFTDDDVRVEEIIILENGVAQELLFQQFITSIEVDGSNNKWIGTVGSGLFYVSSDGQKTIYHFTKDNSPLPSNNINDLSIDETSGVIYIATDKGLVSFLSGGSGPQEDLLNAYTYPNPVRPGFNIVEEKVKIKDISENVNIKITDIEGNLVAEAQSRTNLRYNGYNLEIDGGTAYWNGKNLANNVVASGVYLVMLSDLDTFETRVLKLMVIR